MKPSKVKPEVGLSVADAGGGSSLAVPANEILCDMMTDSGNNTFFPEQREIIGKYEGLVESNDMFQYAKSSTRQHLNKIIRASFGE